MAWSTNYDGEIEREYERKGLFNYPAHADEIWGWKGPEGEVNLPRPIFQDALL